MNSEEATPENIMHDLGYLCAQLAANGNSKASDDLIEISQRLAFWFEQQRQRDI